MSAEEDGAAGVDGADVVDVEVLADHTAARGSAEGFLKVRRLEVRTVFSDGTRTAPYACDIVSRDKTDAVTLLLFDDRTGPDGARSLRVLLKAGVRPPVFLRRRLALTQPDGRRWDRLVEMVAGMLEPGDVGPRGVERRAAEEAREEAGVDVAPDEVLSLGAEAFPSPGVTDEKVHFRAARADLDATSTPTGDGSAMEQGTTVRVLTIDEAIAACRAGDVPDLKTEVALLRLCDAIGYLPSLRCFVEDLPPELGERHAPPGLRRLPRPS